MIPTLFGPDTDKAAIISQCGLYRYTLTRRWGAGGTVNWVMLNPSRADAEVDDNTTVRCTNFSRSWGYGGLAVTNLFAFRSTDPKRLLTAADPIGPENDDHIRAQAEAADLIVCAWGDPPARLKGRAVQVLALVFALDALHCLCRTASGQPGHPLRLRADLRPAPMGERREGPGGQSR